ncbi:Thymidylate synthase [Desulfosarcina cetonica]|uniref:hypothetical protein n=1 Tax=Desulfosarcina cetonica TaxID=90730 RepID=UPI0006D09E30|nr:hypothetical protein [Desulfosarcina cetonica]VTR66944.1 Thymidylate synthase [Desulfosarcina cetonica]
MTTDVLPVPINGINLSEAWAKAFLRAYDSPQGIVAPGIVSFPVDDDNSEWELETADIRNALENQLDMLDICSANQSNIETVAGTIFPETIWKRCGGDRKQLRDRYLKMWPQIIKCRNNDRGTYFKRLISFSDEGINQIEAIIDEWERSEKKARRSALQAGIFDPYRDHIPGPYLGFPCLQQVVFHPIGPKGRGGLKVVAFYANQLLIEKAYGNYLGLYRLGRFIAGEMELTLRGVTCIATNLKRWNKHNKGDFKGLAELLRKEVPDA